MIIEAQKEINNMILANPFYLKYIICDATKGRKYLHQMLEDLEQTEETEENLIVKGFISNFLDKKNIARIYFEKALIKKAESIMGLAGLGQLALLEMKHDEAIKLLQQAQNLAPKNIFILVKIGKAYARKKNYVEAERSFQEVLKIDPYLIEAWCGLGVIHILQNNFSEAIKYLKKAYEINPNHINVSVAYGVLNSFQKNFPEAKIYFKKALKLDPHNIGVLLNYGILYQKQKLFNKAEEIFQKVVELDPTNNLALTLLNSIPRFKEVRKKVDNILVRNKTQYNKCLSWRLPDEKIHFAIEGMKWYSRYITLTNKRLCFHDMALERVVPLDCIVNMFIDEKNKGILTCQITDDYGYITLMTKNYKIKPPISRNKSIRDKNFAKAWLLLFDRIQQIKEIVFKYLQQQEGPITQNELKILGRRKVNYTLDRVRVEKINVSNYTFTDDEVVHNIYKKKKIKRLTSYKYDDIYGLVFKWDFLANDTASPKAKLFHKKSYIQEKYITKKDSLQFKENKTSISDYGLERNKRIKDKWMGKLVNIPYCVAENYAYNFPWLFATFYRAKTGKYLPACYTFPEYKSDDRNTVKERSNIRYFP